MLEVLDGIDLWDGVAHRGPSSVRFAASGADAVIASVEPAADPIRAERRSPG